MKPVIGITPEAITLRTRPDGRGAFCGVSYSRAIERTGGVPLILPLTSHRRILDYFLRTCDGLLLTGGGDVNPKRYGARPDPATAGVDDVRDEMEIYLTRQALKQDLPVLGICRGIQLMNVALGGTLIQDLPGHRNPKPEALSHRLKWSKPKRLPVCSRVNTSHHQVVDRVADGWRVVAQANDGAIEALEWPAKKFFCAVQFHPERLVDVTPSALKLFRALVAASSGRTRARSARSRPAGSGAARS